MTTLPIPGGLLNREIVDFAYSALGLNDSMFTRTDEEYADGMIQLKALAGEWPFDQLGFVEEVARPGEESGIERKWLSAVGYSLAARISATIGRALKPGAAAAHARMYSRLCSTVSAIPRAEYAPGTARGAGHRLGRQGQYFVEGE